MNNKETSDKDVANIEEKVKRQTENAIKYYKNIENIEEVPIDILRAMYKDVLAEREQDKKRIQELEEEIKGKVDNTKKLIEVTNLYLNSIPKQKVKDVLQKNRNELFSTTYLSKEQYEPYKKQIDRINKIERELLEGEK